MAKEIIEMNEAEVSEVNETQEEKPAKKIKVFGRVITVEKAEKPTEMDEQPKPKKNGKKLKKVLIAAAIGTAAVIGVAAKALSNAGKTVEVDDPEQEYLPETDYSVSDDENTDEFTEPDSVNPENQEVTEE